MLSPEAELNDVAETLLEQHDAPSIPLLKSRCRQFVARAIRATLEHINYQPTHPDPVIEQVLLDLDKGYRGVEKPPSRIAI